MFCTFHYFCVLKNHNLNILRCKCMFMCQKGNNSNNNYNNNNNNYNNNNNI